MASFCPNCGAPTGGMKFCTTCGVRLEQEEKVSVTAPIEEVTVSAPAQEELAVPIIEEAITADTEADGKVAELQAEEPSKELQPEEQPEPMIPMPQLIMEEQPMPNVQSQPVFQPMPSVQPQSVPTPVSGQPVQARPQPIPVQAVEETPGKGSAYEPISTGGYIGIFFLSGVPLVGFIFLIVWACGGCKKISKTNYSRAMLILMLIMVIVGTVLGVTGYIFTDMIIQAINSMY